MLPIFNLFLLWFRRFNFHILIITYCKTNKIKKALGNVKSCKLNNKQLDFPTINILRLPFVAGKFYNRITGIFRGFLLLKNLIWFGKWFFTGKKIWSSHWRATPSASALASSTHLTHSFTGQGLRTSLQISGKRKKWWHYPAKQMKEQL